MSDAVKAPAGFADIRARELNEVYVRIRKCAVGQGWSASDNWPDLPALTPVNLAIQTEWLDTAAAEKCAATLTSTCPGWFRRRSRLSAFEEPQPDIAPLDPEHGPLLQGEWALNDDESAALMFSGGDTWRFTTFRDSDPEAGEGSALAEDMAIFSRDGYGQLLYRVYWGADVDDPTALRRICWRFRGFE